VLVRSATLLSRTPFEIHCRNQNDFTQNPPSARSSLWVPQVLLSGHFTQTPPVQGSKCSRVSLHLQLALHRIPAWQGMDSQRAIFTTADDQIQGLWAWHRYAEQAINMAAPDEVAKGFPPSAYPMTHEWVRRYDPQEMAKAVVQVHPFILVRHSLIGLVTICEAALFRLNERLASLGKSEEFSKAFKLLKWAFKIVRNSPLASKAATARLPQTCGDLDNARRLRNCIVHRNGCYARSIFRRE
jgi:hypothetical protein